MAKAQTEWKKIWDLPWDKTEDEDPNGDKLCNTLCAKYEIPDGVFIFSPCDGPLLTSDIPSLKPWISAFVKGALTSDDMDLLLWFFMEIAECDYGWILIDRPMHFYGGGGACPSCEEIDKEIISIGTRSKKKVKLPKLFSFSSQP